MMADDDAGDLSALQREQLNDEGAQKLQSRLGSLHATLKARCLGAVLDGLPGTPARTKTVEAARLQLMGGQVDVDSLIAAAPPKPKPPRSRLGGGNSRASEDTAIIDHGRHNAHGLSRQPSAGSAATGVTQASASISFGEGRVLAHLRRSEDPNTAVRAREIHSPASSGNAALVAPGRGQASERHDLQDVSTPPPAATPSRPLLSPLPARKRQVQVNHVATAPASTYCGSGLPAAFQRQHSSDTIGDGASRDDALDATDAEGRVSRQSAAEPPHDAADNDVNARRRAHGSSQPGSGRAVSFSQQFEGQHQTRHLVREGSRSSISVGSLRLSPRPSVRLQRASSVGGSASSGASSGTLSVSSSGAGSFLSRDSASGVNSSQKQQQLLLVRSNTAPVRHADTNRLLLVKGQQESSANATTITSAAGGFYAADGSRHCGWQVAWGQLKAYQSSHLTRFAEDFSYDDFLDEMERKRGRGRSGSSCGWRAGRSVRNNNSSRARLLATASLLPQTSIGTVASNDDGGAGAAGFDAAATVAAAADGAAGSTLVKVASITSSSATSSTGGRNRPPPPPLSRRASTTTGAASSLVAGSRFRQPLQLPLASLQTYLALSLRESRSISKSAASLLCKNEHFAALLADCFWLEHGRLVERVAAERDWDRGVAPSVSAEGSNGEAAASSSSSVYAEQQTALTLRIAQSLLSFRADVHAALSDRVARDRLEEVLSYALCEGVAQGFSLFFPGSRVRYTEAFRLSLSLRIARLLSGVPVTPATVITMLQRLFPSSHPGTATPASNAPIANQPAAASGDDTEKIPIPRKRRHHLPQHLATSSSASASSQHATAAIILSDRSPAGSGGRGGGGGTDPRVALLSRTAAAALTRAVTAGAMAKRRPMSAAGGAAGTSAANSKAANSTGNAGFTGNEGGPSSRGEDEEDRTLGRPIGKRPKTAPSLHSPTASIAAAAALPPVLAAAGEAELLSDPHLASTARSLGYRTVFELFSVSRKKASAEVVHRV